MNNYKADEVDLKDLPEYEKAAMKFFIQKPLLGDPFIDLTIQLDVTEAYTHYKNQIVPTKTSFFSFLVWKIKQAIGSFKSLNYRFLEGKWYYLPDPPVFIPYLTTDEHRFKFIILEDLNQITNWEQYIHYFREQEKASNFNLDAKEGGGHYFQIAVFFSNLPKLQFTAFKANSLNCFSAKQSVVLGHRYEQDGRLFMPLYIHSHHATSDGLILMKLVEKIESLIIS